VDAPDRRGLTPLHYAASQNHRAIAVFLAQAGASLEVRGTYRGAGGMCPLAVACRDGHAGIVQALLRQRADPCFRNFGENLLHVCANLGHAQAAATLLTARVEVNDSNPAGLTPLMRAAKTGCVATTSVLLAARADVLATDGRGRSCRDHCDEGPCGDESRRRILALFDAFDAGAKRDDGWRLREVCCCAQ